jgi:hypothetical protein
MMLYTHSHKHDDIRSCYKIKTGNILSIDNLKNLPLTLVLLSLCSPRRSSSPNPSLADLCLAHLPGGGEGSGDDVLCPIFR